MRGALACLLAGAAGLAVLVVLGLAGGSVLPGLLAAWLVGLALPLGAVALLLGLEAAGLGALALAAMLRPLLVLLVPVALLAVPLLLGWGHLVAGAAGAAHTGFAARWYSGPLVAGREAAFLLAWLLMALLLARPGRARRTAGGLLLLHVAMLTVAGTDWLAVAEPGLDPSLLGILLLLMQVGTALAVALLLPGGRSLPGKAAVPAGAAALLLGLLAGWAFVQFVQFLVVWSANLPREVGWYLRRGTGLGLASQWLALGVLLLASGLLLPAGLGRRVPVVMLVAGLVLLLHLVEALWLVAPAYRGAMTVSVADVAALAGVGGVLLGCLLLVGGRVGTQGMGAPGLDAREMAR